MVSNRFKVAATAKVCGEKSCSFVLFMGDKNRCPPRDIKAPSKRGPRTRCWLSVSGPGCSAANAGEHGQPAKIQIVQKFLAVSQYCIHSGVKQHYR